MKNFYNYVDYFFDSPNSLPFKKEFLFVILVCVLSAAFVLWLLEAVGIFKMSARLGIKRRWLAFIYPVFPFAVGRVAEKYVRHDGKRSAKFSIWLILVYVIKLLLTAAFLVSFIFAIYKIGVNAFNAIEADSELVPEMFKSMIPAIALYFICLAVSVLYSVLRYVAVWRIFGIFAPQNATLFLVLSILLIKGLLPIFIFAVRNKVPQNIGDVSLTDMPPE